MLVITSVQRGGNGPYIGELSWFNVTIIPGDDAHLSQDVWVARTDIWWFCGGKTLRPILSANWRGICALIQLIMPFYVLQLNDRPQAPSAMFKLHQTRVKCSAPHGSFDDRVYKDTIGLPQGVPDEFKACNQVTAGFE